MKTLTVES